MAGKLVMDFKDYKSKLTKKQIAVLDVVKNGTLEFVQRLVRAFWTLNKYDLSFNHILLLTALRRQHKSITEYLIRGNCPVTVPQKTGHYCSPLYYAVKMHDLEIFESLWKKGASIFYKDADDITALELAMIQHDDNIINFVLNNIRLPRNVEMLEPDRENDIAYFHAACWIGNWEAIEMFLSRNFSLDSRSTFNRDEWKGFTPLHFALQRPSNRSEAVNNLLLHNDVDLFATDQQGRTPIHFALRKNSYLLVNGSVIGRISRSIGDQLINPVDDDGLSHFHILCSLKFPDEETMEHLNCVKHFIDRGVDLNGSISLTDASFPGYTVLHLAVQKSCWNILNILLENGADPNKTNKKGLTPLLMVLSDKEMDDDHRLMIVNLFLKYGADPATKDFQGRAPLHIVCSDKKMNCKKRFEIVELLLRYGADSVAKNPEDRTPLHIVFSDHNGRRPLDDCERLLLSQNLQCINHTDKDGISYLHMACTGDDLSIVKTLVANGAHINSRVPADSPRCPNFSALHFAAQLKRVSIVEFLLSHAASVNFDNTYDSSPLYLACSNEFEQVLQSDDQNHANAEDIVWRPSRENYIRTVKLLLDHRAEVNYTSSQCSTPLMLNFTIPNILSSQDNSWNQKLKENVAEEVYARQKEVMDMLLQHGANINACDKYSDSILHILTTDFEKYPFRKELIKIALEKGADVNALSKGSEQFTPLHVAVEESMRNRQDTSLIDLYLENGANINARSSNLDTPLHVVAQSYLLATTNADVLTKLLHHPDIDVNARNNLGQTPLHLAMDRRNYFTIEKLLESGADINLTDTDGYSPIHVFLKYVEEYSPGTISINANGDRKILIAVVIHVKKLIRLKLCVAETAYRDFVALSSFLPTNDLVSIDSKIDKELQHLKSQKLDNYTSYYDILFKDSNAMSKHVLNDDLRDAIMSTLAKSQFPYFGGFIKQQYDTGCRRLSVLEPAKSALNYVSSLNFPDACSEKIFGPLSNEDLRNFMEFVSSIRGSKRRTDDTLPLEKSLPKVPRLDE